MAAALRLEVGDVRGAPEYARFVAEELGTIPGVRGVTASPSTGSVLVFYAPPALVDRERESVPAIVAPAERAVVANGSSTGAVIAGRIGQLIVAGLVEFALQRTLGPFFFRRRC